LNEAEDNVGSEDTPQDRKTLVRVVVWVSGVALATAVFFLTERVFTDPAEARLSVLKLAATLLIVVLTFQIELMLEGKISEDKILKRVSQHNHGVAQASTVLLHLASSNWLTVHLESITKSVHVIETQPDYQPFVRDIRAAVESFERKLREARELGRLFVSLGSEDTFLIEQTNNLQHSLQAIFVEAINRPSGAPSSSPGIKWWDSAPGRGYWHAQKGAMKRKVTIERIFVYQNWELVAPIAQAQANDGVHVWAVEASKLNPSECLPAAIWDGKLASHLELESGQAIGHLHFVGDDVKRWKAIIQNMKTAGWRVEALPSPGGGGAPVISAPAALPPNP
jgi:hypothetical protein